MAETIKLEIVTPERMLVSVDAEGVQIPGRSGYLGILPKHAPLITELAVGEITYRVEGQIKIVSVAWGFAEVLPAKVTILAETAEKAEEIDVPRAQAAKQKAEEELKKAGPAGNAEAQDALQRANSRLDVASRVNRVNAH